MYPRELRWTREICQLVLHRETHHVTGEGVVYESAVCWTHGLGSVPLGPRGLTRQVGKIHEDQRSDCC